jgi:hypothetical protein
MCQSVEHIIRARQSPSVNPVLARQTTRYFQHPPSQYKNMETLQDLHASMQVTVTHGKAFLRMLIGLEQMLMREIQRLLVAQTLPTFA